MRRLVLLLAAGLVLAACGETPRPATEPRVKLKLDAPDDGGSVRADHVDGARDGHARRRRGPASRARTPRSTGGEFTADVSLQPGGNVIDITATAPGRRPATDAVRVMRDMRVEVPDVVGSDPRHAATALRALGLKATEERGGSWIDRVLARRRSTSARRSPPAGTLVEPRHDRDARDRPRPVSSRASRAERRSA